jgi:hypothetical protein
MKNELPDFRDWRTSRLVFLLTEYVQALAHPAKPVRGHEALLYRKWVGAMQTELERRQTFRID